MFTGIITAIGSVGRVERKGHEAVFEFVCPYEALVLGESVACDGVCLTVVTTTARGFTAAASAETLSRTTLGQKQSGDRVNLERALRVDDRLGGHIVAGHVDAVGRVRARIDSGGEAERWQFDAPASVLKFIAEKGSIAIDGVSLTVNVVDAEGFEVTLVPFTLGHTTLGDKRAGSPVNLEADVLARYVARALEGVAPRGGVTSELLARAGFMGTKAP
ncbi:MAG: riboflavin synthase [Myxococcales bacterium]|nr:riboflavin synthase [Myxococcales bacterium]